MLCANVFCVILEEQICNASMKILGSDVLYAFLGSLGSLMHSNSNMGHQRSTSKGIQPFLETYCTKGLSISVIALKRRLRRGVDAFHLGLEDSVRGQDLDLFLGLSVRVSWKLETFPQMKRVGDSRRNRYNKLQLI